MPAFRAWDLDFPDPFVLVSNGTAHAFATESGVVHIQELEGAELVRLSDLHDALPSLPRWATPYSSWAPAVLERDGRFLLYYTVLVADTQHHCIGVATAERPEGPYVDPSDEPFLCPMATGGAIDPSPFVDDDGSLYLLWKNDGITLRQESAIWSQPLRGDGLALAGEPTRILATDQAWEYPHIEAPSMARIGDRYWLAYSGNWWNQAGYGVGVAMCTTPTGPCDKPFDRPVIRSIAGAYGPGGLEFFRDDGGRLFAAYHAWREKPGYPGNRALWITSVATEGNAPTFGSGR